MRLASPTQPTLRVPIRAFCPENKRVVHMEYPDPSNGWSYSHASCRNMHQWTHGQELILSGRHRTCGNAVFPRAQKCHACSNPHWRLVCTEPCNTFFLTVLDSPLSISKLSQLVHDSRPASPEELSAYQRCSPTSKMLRKSASPPHLDDDRRERLEKCERVFHESVRSKSAEDLSGVVQATEEDDLLQVLLDDNGAIDVPPAEAYEHLVQLCADRWASGVWLSADDIRHQCVSHGSTVAPSDALARLFALAHKDAPRPHQCHLFVLPLKLKSWLEHLSGTHRIVFGFYVATDEREYRGFYTGQWQSTHLDAARVEPTYERAAARIGPRALRPVLVACYDGPTVSVDAVLPLGITCAD